MSKIICDICGTTYPDTAEQCPICGCAKNALAQSMPDDLFVEEVQAGAAASRVRGGRFSASNVRKRNRNTPAYEVQPPVDEPDRYPYEEEGEPQSNAILVALLVIVIAALIVVTGFIFFKYFLPNAMPEETTPTIETTEQTEPSTEQTEEPTVPCVSIALTSSNTVTLSEPGHKSLLNVVVSPANTTDQLTYVSSDESVVTVNEEGRVTAVGEGEAVVTITCGAISLDCKFICDFSGETPSEPTAPSESTEPSETTEPATEPTEPLKDITLRVIRYTDLTFNGPNQGFTFVLDGLSNEEVQWTSLDENVVTVNEKGFVTSIGRGQTTIICQYGDQKVEIIVNCRW